MVPLAGSAWAAAWLGTWQTPAAWAVAGVGVAVASTLAVLRRSARWLAAAILVAGLAGLGGALAYRLSTGPVAALAGQQAAVSAELLIRTDLHASAGSGLRGAYGTARATLVEVTGRGETNHLRTPVLVVVTGAALEPWSRLPVGSRVEVSGRLEAPDRGSDLAAIVRVRSAPRLVQRAAAPLRLVERVRQGLRDAVAHRRTEPRALVPALVLGDTSAMTPELTADFSDTGLTHLTAVSGANLTLLLAFLLTFGRWVGVRGWWLRMIGLLGVITFVGLCRTEPSVLRAAAMGLVALAALGSGARRAGLRNLSVAAVILLAADPFLSRSVGFTLSVLASAGIVWWARRWAMIMNRWLPMIIAESIAVPLAAQLATQPVVAAIAGKLSASGLPANALAAAFVGPATVLGFAAAGASMISAPLAAIFGFGAAWSAQLIIWVAHAGARLPGSSLRWPVTPAALVWLTLASVTVAWLMASVLARRWLSLLLTGALTGCLAVAPAQPGWPPPDWVLVACEVGQGDGLAVRAGARSAVVVDAGPDPAAMRRCLDQLEISTVPLLILTHFHADHVDGLDGVGRRRQIGDIWVSPLTSPGYEVQRVRHWAGPQGRPVSSPPVGTTATVGDLSLQVLGPVDHPITADDESSAQNDESLVVMITTRGLRLLLTGDVEPPGQAAILGSGADLRADVLKIPHHGSARQDPAFFAATGARLAIASAGLDNDYGHPAPRTVQLINSLGMTLLRTDQQGSVAITSTAGRLAAFAQR
jgi:competence protein ComEC